MFEQETKKKALFEALDSAEKSLNRNLHRIPLNIGDLSGQTKRYNKIDKYKNKNSIFKRPSQPLSKCLSPRSRPRHELNPEKYTKYSLSDVSDLSDFQNKAAAFSFLKEMEERKLTDDDESGTSTSEHTKIVFKNSTKLKSSEKEVEDKIEEKRIQGKKFVMAEYVVGGEKKKGKPERKKTNSNDGSRISQLKLSHLEEEDE